MSLSKVATVVIILILVAVVAGPLSSTATLTSIELSPHAILVSVGIDPLAAGYCYSRCGIHRGASPPASGALFVACGLTECDPPKIFMPLIKWFVLPITCIAVLVCLGILPAPALRRAYEKLYYNLILIGFLIFSGWMHLRGGSQIVCLLIGQPEIMISLEGVTKVIFPAASISGLLCF